MTTELLQFLVDILVSELMKVIGGVTFYSMLKMLPPGLDRLEEAVDDVSTLTQVLYEAGFGSKRLDRSAGLIEKYSDEEYERLMEQLLAYLETQGADPILQ